MTKNIDKKALTTNYIKRKEIPGNHVQNFTNLTISGDAIHSLVVFANQRNVIMEREYFRLSESIYRCPTSNAFWGVISMGT